MSNDENKKTCQSCRYFSKHYFIYRGELKSTGRGNCVSDCTPFKKRHRQAFDEGCENWEPDQTRKAEQKERIEDAIRDMERHLKQILQILTSE